MAVWNYDRVFNIIASMPDDMLSINELVKLTFLNYKQVTRSLQILMRRNLIFKYRDRESGIGRGKGKKCYYGLEDKAYANIKKYRKE